VYQCNIRGDCPIRFARFPSDVELEGAHNYLANVPLADYGPSIVLSDDDHEALHVATDDFSLSSLKVQLDTCLLAICEFIDSDFHLTCC